MSVSQIKKQFEELAAYLGKDVTGQAKLKKLKDAVKELRTQLASAQAKEAKATSQADVLAECCRAKDRELSSATVEFQRWRQIAANLSREVEAAKARDATVQPSHGDFENTGEETYTELELKRVIKRLRHKQSMCPESTRKIRDLRGSENDWINVWDRHAIAKGWSHESLWALGATMAILAEFFGVAAIESQSRTRKNLVPTHDANSDACVFRHVIGWLSKNIGEPPTSQRTGVARVVNLKSELIPEATVWLNGMESRPFSPK